MTNNETKLSTDELLGAPSSAQVKKAVSFLESFGSSTEALVALVAALRGMESSEQSTIANIVEEICETVAEVEIAAM